MPFLETIRTRRYPLLADLPAKAWAKTGFKEVSPEPEWFDRGKKLIDENPEIIDWKEMKAIIKTALSDELGKELSTKREGQLRKYFEELHRDTRVTLGKQDIDLWAETRPLVFITGSGMLSRLKKKIEPAQGSFTSEELAYLRKYWEKKIPNIKELQESYLKARRFLVYNTWREAPTYEEAIDQIKEAEANMDKSSLISPRPFGHGIVSSKGSEWIQQWFKEPYELKIDLPPDFNFWGYTKWEEAKARLTKEYAEPEGWADEDWVKAKAHFERQRIVSDIFSSLPAIYSLPNYTNMARGAWWPAMRQLLKQRENDYQKATGQMFSSLQWKALEKWHAEIWKVRGVWMPKAIRKLVDEPARIKDYKNFFGFKKIEDWPEVKTRLNEWFAYWKGTTYTIPRHKTFLIPLYRIQERIIPEKSWLVKSISIPEKKAEFEQYINEINMSSWLEWRETESRREGPDWWRKYGKISNYLPDIAEYNSEIDRKFPETETERIMHEMFKLGPTLNKKMKDSAKSAVENRIKLSLKLQPGVWQNTPPVGSAFLQSMSQSHSVMLGMSGKLGHWAPYMGSIIQQALKQGIPKEVLLHPEGIKVITGIAQDMAVAQERVNDARRDQAKKMKIAQIASVLAFIPAILAAPAVIAKGFSSVIKLITQPLTSLTNIFSKQKLTELVGKAGMNMITGGKISTKDLAKNLLIPVEIAEVIELGEGVVNLKGMYELTKKNKSTLLKRPLTEAEEKESEDEVDQAVSDSLAKEQVDRTEEMLAKEGIVPEVIVPEKIVEKVVIEKVIPKGIIPEITVPETILIKRDIIPEVVPGEVVPGKVPKYLLVGIPLLLLSGWAISRKKPKITYPLGV